MKAILTAALVCTMVASAAAADQMDGGGRGPNGNRGWGPNSGGVYVGLPPSMFDGSYNGGIPPPDLNEMRCRDARHICFDQWGVDEPGYGRCMATRGC